MKYLRNPLKIGVYDCEVRIDLRSFDKLVDYVAKRCERSEITRVKGHLKVDTPFSIMSVLNRLSFALSELAYLEKSPRMLAGFYDECQSGSREEESLYEEIFGSEHPIEIIEPLIFSDKQDVLAIDIISPSESDLKLALHGNVRDLDPLILELTSVDEKGVKLFLKFLKAIPYIGKKTQVVREPQQTFSSRYSFRPYALAVRLMLQEKEKVPIPKDLHDFIDKAAIYHLSKEWRTSIVLSAITVESLLADLYEESNQEPSPEKATLGELYENVKKKIIFPPNIADSIVKTNNARISAVHRSLRLAVSEREATSALFGAVNLSTWYLFEFKKRQESSASQAAKES
jgi:hypothetical protein